MRRRTDLRAVLAALMLAAAALAATGPPASATTVAQALCPPAGPGFATCAGEILVDSATGAPVHPAVDAGTPVPQVGSPAWLQWAYDLQGPSAAGPSAPDTVAVVDPYADPQAESDMAAYRAFFGLPACTSASGCFSTVDQNGGTSFPSTTNAGWHIETSLDLDMVSAICPTCHILLVQADDAGQANLTAAEQTAAAAGAAQITNSWSWPAGPGDDAGHAFDPAGIAVVAATGDHGYGTFGVPAELPYVTAAGGTSLSASANARGLSETAWSGTASGCAIAGNIKPVFQADRGCANRSVADISADADLNRSGVLVYDSTFVPSGQTQACSGNGCFFAAGGTSVASPIVAAYYALVGGGAGVGGPAWAYTHGDALNDIVGGSDGSCVGLIAYLCTALAGYDGPTGEGSVSGDVIPGAPQPAGSEVRDLTGTAATLSGGVYTNQLDTQVYWQYGPTTGYGESTPASDVTPALGVSAVSAGVSDLSPGTVYHYRLVATSCGGTSYGYDASFISSPSSTTTTSTSSSTSSTTTVSASCPVTTSTTTATSATVTAGPTPPPVPGSTTTESASATTSAGTATAPLTTQTITTTRTSTRTTAGADALRASVGPFARAGAHLVRLRVTCSRACAGRAVLNHAGVLIGRSTFSVRSGGVVTVLTMRLTARGRRLVRAHRLLPAVVVLSLNGASVRAAIEIL